MIVYKCDLCGEMRECLQKEIDGREYDLCAGCWNALAEKLKGKGRLRKQREVVELPIREIVKDKKDEGQRPIPGEPPTVWYKSERPH